MQLLLRHDFFKDIIGMIPEAAQQNTNGKGMHIHYQ